VTRTWAQPLVCVSNVPASSAWYQAVLGATSAHGGEHYDQLVVDGEIVLQLHDDADDANHAPLVDPSTVRGNGVVLWFEVADIEAATKRARLVDANVEREPFENVYARQQELWLRDPDGYRVVIAGPSAYRPRR
jgi:catechol 2,3-dioxygenase-like lactoylglutathione lyase family enzyme